MSCLSCSPKGHFGLQGSQRLKAEVVSQGMMASACVLCHPSIICSHIYKEGQGSELQGKVWDYKGYGSEMRVNKRYIEFIQSSR